MVYPNLKPDKIYVNGDHVRELQKTVLLPSVYAEVFAMLEVRLYKSLLIHGLPGTGKAR